MGNQIKKIQELVDVTQDGILGKQTLNGMKNLYNISNEEVANFMGQCAHESCNFTVTQENLNYNSYQLRSLFCKYFTAEESEEYAHKPQRIANRIYANRMGNGDEASGDGWKHRGMGLIQLTGKDNQDDFADFIGDKAVKTNPELISEDYAIISAYYFFCKNNLWQYSKSVNYISCLKLSRAINLGNPNSTSMPHGFENRFNKSIEYLNKILLV